MTIINEEDLINLPEFKELCNFESQITYYKKLGASENILQLVLLNNKTYGTFCEKIVKNKFNFQNSQNSEHDAIFNGCKIEIKSPRFGKNGNYFIQHLKKEHDFEFILVNLLVHNGYEMRIIKKSDAIPYMTLQKGEGFFLLKKYIEMLGKQIYTKRDLKRYIYRNKKRPYILE